ncbi:pentatricopeptide repeat-containing protein At4g02750 [Selaginella moellendorffii]|uniref:pentatricopeptide repeat-containing protein At4g02750 n=1 Tax=Selaginella moellendorffii TaxID=88036 RepID=UPI000D1CD4D8|nr:pentatricopeptide repeat-containing protein At4g02750 [Selaginella moellendorffii]|eukprot:XP_024535496.1 pentatricopeptide repeat-containing protein At4g02750 [Selaginella moellendorffii]
MTVALRNFEFLCHNTFDDIVSRQNKLISALAKDGSLANAKSVFDTMPAKNIVSWNAMLTALARHGQFSEAIDFFYRMPGWNLVSFNLMLGTYARQKNLEALSVMFYSMLEKSLVSWTIFVSAYAQSGYLKNAALIFDGMPARNLFSWNSILDAIAKSGDFQSVIDFLKRLPEYDLVSGNSVLKKFASLGHSFVPKSFFDWMELHDIITWTLLLSFHLQENESRAIARRIYESMPEHDIPSTTLFLAAYAQRGGVDVAKDVFDGMPYHDVISSNAMLYVYARNSKVDEAENLFSKLCEKDSVSWNAMLAVYAGTGHMDRCNDLLYYIPEITPMSFSTLLSASKTDFDSSFLSFILAKLPHHDLFSATALVAVYARNGLFLEAETTFNTMLSRNLVSLNVMLEALVQNRDLAFAKEFFNCRMPEHDLVSLTTLAVALADNNHQHEALKLFHHQHHDSFSTTVLLTSLRQAGFSSKATKNSERSLEQDSPIVQNSAFQAKSGESIGDALDTFWSMCVNGLDSNEVLMISVLNACSHSGDVMAGRRYFQSICANHGTPWTRQEFGCMIDLLARAGNLEEPQSSLLGIIGRSYSFEPKAPRLDIQTNWDFYRHKKCSPPKSSSWTFLLRDLEIKTNTANKNQRPCVFCAEQACSIAKVAHCPCKTRRRATSRLLGRKVQGPAMVESPGFTTIQTHGSQEKKNYLRVSSSEFSELRCGLAESRVENEFVQRTSSSVEMEETTS